MHKLLTTTLTTYISFSQRQARDPRASAASRRLFALQKPHHHASTGGKCTCRGSPPASRLRRPASASLCRAQQWPPRQCQQQSEMPQGQSRGQDDAASARSTPVVPLLLCRSHGTCVCVVHAWCVGRGGKPRRASATQVSGVESAGVLNSCMACASGRALQGIYPRKGRPQHHTHTHTPRLPLATTVSPHPIPFLFPLFLLSQQVAVSRFVKDVPSTLTDMADEAADAVGATATGTNPDGSYTNAGKAVEVRSLCLCLCDVCFSRDGLCYSDSCMLVSWECPASTK